MNSAKVLVAGVGNRFRGDDGAGQAVISELRNWALPAAVELIELSGEGAALMEAWRGYETVILIDAVRSGAEVGTLHRLEAGSQCLPKNFVLFSSHAFGVASAIELARTLGELPAHVIVYGIEGQSFAPGQTLSAAVAAATSMVARRILGDLDVEPAATGRKRSPA